MAKLNAEVDTSTAAKYRVRSYPTILVLKSDGTEIDRLVGYSRAPEYLKQVEDYLAGRNTLASMEAEAGTKGNDPAFVTLLADKYYGHGLYDEARVQYEKLVTLDPKNTTGQVDDALYTLARMERKIKDYASTRKYAQMILDRYPDSDMFRPAHLEIAGAWRRQGEWTTARKLYLDYAKRFPNDEDAPYAREQADTLAVKIAASGGKGA
jgi:tetratricopeptide (TPR) repeat protein